MQHLVYLSAVGLVHDSFSASRKIIFKCFVFTKPPFFPPPPARVGVYGRKHEVQEK